MGKVKRAWEEKMKEKGEEEMEAKWRDVGPKFEREAKERFVSLTVDEIKDTIEKTSS